MSVKSLDTAALALRSLVSDGAGVASSAYLCHPLPAELSTGHQAIDFEHQMLLNCMATLRQVCANFSTYENCAGCVRNKRADCEGMLVSLLGDLLIFIMDHFRTEEQLMRDSLLMMVDREQCEAHMEDHAAISGKVQQIIGALDPMRTPSLVRELDALLYGWVTHHVELHDRWLARWVEREDSVLRTVARTAG